MKSSAVLSACQRYRYQLRRVWDDGKVAVLFVCLNPSAADAATDDNSSRVCVNYAKKWGYGSLLIGNLFAFRSTHPALLLTADDPIGPDNDRYLLELQAVAKIVVCAWGNRGGLLERDVQALRLIEKPYCITRLKSGRPGHPLYKSAELKPTAL